MKPLLFHTLSILFLATGCGQVRSTSDAKDPEASGVIENYTAGEKVYYRVSSDVRVRATVLKKINDREYLLTIHQNSKGVRRKVSVSKMEKVD